MKYIFKNSALMKFLLNCWPPFLFTGIRVTTITPDFKQAQVKLTLRPWNANAVNVHFGGSLYAMTDPFYMMLILAQLGPDYIVWDKSADIEYIKPGKGKVFADFNITAELIDDIIENTAQGDKYLPTYPVNIIDERGELVAKVNKTIYIRKKQKHA